MSASKRAIEAEGRARRAVVDVGDVDRLPRDERRARHRALVDRDRELARVEGHRVVLRELEAQRALARVGLVALDDVDAPGVGAGDEAALLEDEAEQLVDVALGRDGARDLDELAELVAVALGHAAALGARALQRHQIEVVLHRDVEARPRQRQRDHGEVVAIAPRAAASTQRRELRVADRRAAASCRRRRARPDAAPAPRDRAHSARRREDQSRRRRRAPRASRRRCRVTTYVEKRGSSVEHARSSSQRTDRVSHRRSRHLRQGSGESRISALGRICGLVRRRGRLAVVALVVRARGGPTGLARPSSASAALRAASRAS